ncbi:MAG: PAS domain S-box protein [Chitinophagaceae bacterium]|nr:PAS domain S-box protein [Chitinophagaceae bacterium]
MTYPGETEFEMFGLFEMTPDLVCIVGKDGYFRQVNPAVISKLGYTADELFSRPVSSFIHPDDAEYTSRERSKLLEGKTLLNFQNRYVTRSGNEVWLEWTSVYLPEKEIVFAIAKDITERKRKEKEVAVMYNRYKSLATHFKSRIEEDRKYLAYELHEELAQLAAVIKMDVAWIYQHGPGEATEARERAENALILSDLLIRTIRRVSFSISPNMLDDLGFNATLEWECREFSILNGIPCHFTSRCNDKALTREVQMDLFRICQEALGNVMEHAEAKNVSIDVNDDDHTVTLRISDDGKGFDTGGLALSAGLQHMRQLAVSINGQLVIQSEPGKGTVVTAVIPGS